jgi:3-deoxy-manno-octulosonate cytidylyltransferase (CMP-KDO synthetase)
MAADTHVRCTDRVAESVEADIVVNIQGDEPLIHPAAIDLLREASLAMPALPCVNLGNVITREADFRNPNQIKAECDQEGNALYMSRQG